MLIKKILENRAAGCLVGGAAGDALGGVIEFIPEHIIKLKFGEKGITSYKLTNGKARFTDDTQLTLFTSEGLLRMHTRKALKKVKPSYEIMLRSYHRWIRTQNGGIFTGKSSIYRNLSQKQIDDILNSGFLVKKPELNKMRAPGRTCINALCSGEKFSFANKPNSSKGCGTAMRAAPAGIYHHKDPEKAFISACELSVLSHGHPTGFIAAGTLAMIIAFIFNNFTLSESIAETLLFLKNRSGSLEFIKEGDITETVRAVENAVSLYEKQIPGKISVSSLGEGWLAEEALSIGLFSALTHENNFKKAVVLAVNHSGDSDSTGSVCGNIVGALNGLNCIPEEYTENLELYSLICETASDLIDNDVTEDFIKKYPPW